MSVLKKIWQKVVNKTEPQKDEELSVLSRQEKFAEWRKTAGRSKQQREPKKGA